MFNKFLSFYQNIFIFCFLFFLLILKLDISIFITNYHAITKCVELSICRSICNLVISHMNSDSALFFEVCQLFEELNIITLSATSKRTNIQGDTGSSYYLTKEVKKQVHQIISNWFTKFNSGSLLSIFRLLVPEVKNEILIYNLTQSL